MKGDDDNDGSGSDWREGNETEENARSFIDTHSYDITRSGGKSQATR